VLSFGQGNPTLKSDDPGQTSAWFMNRYKNDMSPDAFCRHMNNLCENYDPDAAIAMYESYMKGEDVQVTRASQLLAQSTFPKSSIAAMRQTEKKLRSKSCVDNHLLTMFANTQRGWGQSVLSWELHTKKELWGCL